MSFALVQMRQTGDKESKVGGMVILDAEVVNHQDKGNWAGGVAEKTGGKGLVEIERLKERDKAEIGQLTCLFEAVHRFLNTENDVRLSSFVLFNEGEKKEARQDFGGKKISIDFNELGLREGRLKIEVGQIDRAKVGIRGDNRVEQNVHTGKRSNKSGGRDRRLETVAAGGASHAPVDVRVVGTGGAG